MELLHNTFRYEADGKGFRDLTLRVQVQSESAVRDFGSLVYPFASSFESLDIRYVRVRKGDGTIVETPASDVQELDAAVSREAPMYTDEREKHIPVKGLSVGDILEANFRWTVHDPTAPGHFWVDHNYFKVGTCLKEVVEIDVPRDLVVKVRYSGPQPSIHEEASRRVYRFESSNAKAPDEPKIPEWERNYHGVTPPDIQISSFNSWGEVGDWFASLVKPKVDVAPELRAKSDELTKGKATEEEKIRALYDFVSQRFRYIGIDLGIGRYTPHSALEVLFNRYGDCKDKHTLFSALLQASGISATPVLISSRFKIDASFPSPSLFDHVITAIPRGDKLLILDTTPELAPFGLLLPSLRGRDALFASASGGARLISTPSNPPFASYEIFRIDSSIDAKGTMDAKMHLEDRGDNEVALRLAYRSTPQNRWQELTQNLVARMGYGGTVSDVSVAQPEDTANAFWLNCSYHRADLPDWKTQRITLPTPPLFLPDLNQEQKASKEPLPLGTPHDITYESTVKFASGFFPLLPENVDRKTEFAEFTAIYSLEKDSLHGKLHFKTLQDEIPGTERSKFSSLAKLVDETQRRYIFVKGNFPDNFAASLFAGIPTAITIPRLEEALAADPDNHTIILRLSRAYRAAGRPVDSVSILQKAIAAHPDVPPHLFLELGLSYLRIPDVEKALTEFKKVIGGDAEPNDLNEVAYGLAEANAHLAEALDYSTRAVSALSSKTMDIDPEDTEPDDFALMTQLAANWDTLGWVMFRRGDFPLAEKYVAAAWDLVQSPVIGEHLVEVYEKLDKKLNAAAVCNMARAGLFPDADTGLREKLESEMARLRPFLRKLPTGSGVSRSVDGHSALTDVRMFQVPFHPKLAGKSASAEFVVSLLNGAKMATVVFVSGADELRGATAALSSIKYPQSFPEAEPTRVIRKATLNCNIYSRDCTFILMPTDEAAVSKPKFPFTVQSPGT